MLPRFSVAANTIPLPLEYVIPSDGKRCNHISEGKENNSGTSQRDRVNEEIPKPFTDIQGTKVLLTGRFPFPSVPVQVLRAQSRSAQATSGREERVGEDLRRKEAKPILGKKAYCSTQALALSGGRIFAVPPGPTTAAVPKKGRFPIRSTLQHLDQGVVVFKDSVKVMRVKYNMLGHLGEGARKPVFFNSPQIHYKNPWGQIMMFKNITPSLFLRFCLDSGEQVLPDMETKTCKEITEHIKKILGKNEETLKKEEQEKQQLSHLPNFFPVKYCLRECICEVEGQVSCPSLVQLTKEMRGIYKAILKAIA
nr:LOW QUALITY PROTEIN: small ribosomal subunit protein mS25-like [Dasypus novemcinctus]